MEDAGERHEEGVKEPVHLRPHKLHEQLPCTASTAGPRTQVTAANEHAGGAPIKRGAFTFFRTSSSKRGPWKEAGGNVSRDIRAPGGQELKEPRQVAGVRGNGEGRRGGSKEEAW